MAIGIGCLLSVALALFIGAIVAHIRNVPMKPYLQKATILGFIVGTAQGVKIANNDIEKHRVTHRSNNTEKANPITPSKTFSKSDAQKRMNKIMDMVSDPQKIDPKLHAEFYDLIYKYTNGDKEQINVLKFNLATSIRIYKEWVLKDARDSLRLGRPIKSERRQEIEASMLNRNPKFKKQVEIDDSFIYLVANKKPLSDTNESVLYEEKDIERISKKVSNKWLAVEALFDAPSRQVSSTKE